MSELFDEESREAPPPRGSRRSRALIGTAVVLVVLFLSLSTFARLYTDRLWYRNGGYGEVFSTLFWTKAGLFLVFGAVMGLAVGVNMYLAFRFRPFFRPSSPEQSGLDRYRDAVTPIRTWLLVGIAVVLGAFAGSSAIGEWRDYLLWRNGESFGQKDKWFHKDIGFYVFDLPWLHYVVDFTMAVLVVSLIAAAVVHYLYGGIRLQTSRDRLSGAAQVQLSVLLGLFVLAKAADYYLDRFDLVTHSGSRVTGMNYTGHNAVLPAKNILLGIALICAVLFFVNVWRRTWLLPSLGLALLAVSAILLGLIWPGIVQQFQVKPSEADKEAPYIAASIEATRAAYDVEDVDVTPYSKSASVATTKLADLARETSSVPLVDPHLVQQTFEQKQQQRVYYSVAPVLDVDRYPIDDYTGKPVNRAMVLGVRELNQADMNSGDKNWSNLHTVYTHGYGVIAAYANQRPATNGAEQVDTQWAEGLAGAGHTLTQATGDYEPRVYFGEDSPDYSIVGKASKDAPDVELDLPASGTDTADSSGSEKDSNPTSTYDGSGGVPVGSFFNKLMYAVKFGEPNFLLSSRVNSNSEVLYNREPRDRVEKFAPWLTVDSDAYPAVVDGRIVWILDGYTATDRYPGSQRDSFKTMTDDTLQSQSGLRTLPTDEINYMRNAVKATVDAYDGTVKLYAWDESDPILKAWESAFPGTVTPKADIPAELMQHLRYPEDLFKVQRYQLARYHVTDPSDFYQGNDRWEVPIDPNPPATHLQPPYRLFVNQAGDGGTTKAVWSLTSDFVPYGKSNLAAFVSVDSDATDTANYGKIRVLEMQDPNAQGPGQVANDLSNDADVRQSLLPYQSSSSPAQFGNLLTIPVSDGLIYVQPVYATRGANSGSYPELTFVLVSYGGQVGIGSTLGDALSDALGGATGPTTPSTQPPSGGSGGGNPDENLTVAQQISAKLVAAETAFEQAEQAQKAGDTVKWATLMEQGRRLVQEAVDLSRTLPPSQGGTGGSSSSPSASPTATPSATETPH